MNAVLADEVLDRVEQCGFAACAPQVQERRIDPEALLEVGADAGDAVAQVRGVARPRRGRAGDEPGLQRTAVTRLFQAQFL
ncbi:hypothetical protein [Burkholderia sp. Bp9143]|uniref:hypothetical protein n=1 Tax=Burkholderia sp. Bp9143 TaxID=2184574 RepID=UPI0021AB89C7|nr:hypothetical protein [Burkholderia sp. Bp9143]